MHNTGSSKQIPNEGKITLKEEMQILKHRPKEPK